MYNVLLGLHNIIRWLALLLGVFALVRAILGWVNRKEWGAGDRKPASFFAMAMDTQLLLGLILYLFFSPFGLKAITDRGLSAMMQQADYRFFGLEHVFYMVLAVVCAHLGSILPRRAGSSTGKFRTAALWLTLAVAFILLGIPWTRPLFPGL